jgi:hypothetical protein
VRLRDLDAGVPKKLRNILKLKSGQQLSETGTSPSAGAAGSQRPYTRLLSNVFIAKRATTLRSTSNLPARKSSVQHRTPACLPRSRHC